MAREAEFNLYNESVDGRNKGRANYRLVTSGSALKRVGQTGLRVLRGEEAMPTNAAELRTLFSEGVLGKKGDPYSYLSRFGTPVRNYISIRPGAYDVLDASGTRSRRSYQGIFLDSALIEVSQPKNIVYTSINGRNGTRKEFVSNGDFKISISGHIVGDHPDRYPAREVAILRDIVNSPEPLTVICPHLIMFGINTIVVDDWSCPQQEGVYNVQRYSMTAVSHMPVDIYIEEAAKDENANKSRLDTVIADAGGQITEIKSRVREAVKSYNPEGQ